MLNDDDYRTILKYTRGVLRDKGFGGMDERILSDISDNQDVFHKLLYYLKMLNGEIALGADKQLGKVLRRVNRVVKTKSGKQVRGIEIQLTPEEYKTYETERLILEPDEESQSICDELHSIGCSTYN